MHDVWFSGVDIESQNLSVVCKELLLRRHSSVVDARVEARPLLWLELRKHCALENVRFGLLWLWLWTSLMSIEVSRESVAVVESNVLSVDLDRLTYSEVVGVVEFLGFVRIWNVLSSEEGSLRDSGIHLFWFAN